MAQLPVPTPKKETKNQTARRLGIPKSLRQYHARYGNGGGPEAIATVHAQFAVPRLDNGRDRAIAKQVREEAELGIENRAYPPLR